MRQDPATVVTHCQGCLQQSIEGGNCPADPPEAGDLVVLGHTRALEPVHNVNSLWKNSTTPTGVPRTCAEHIARRTVGVPGLSPAELRGPPTMQIGDRVQAMFGIVGLPTVPS